MLFNGDVGVDGRSGTSLIRSICGLVVGQIGRLPSLPRCQSRLSSCRSAVKVSETSGELPPPRHVNSRLATNSGVLSDSPNKKSHSQSNRGVVIYPELDHFLFPIQVQGRSYTVGFYHLSRDVEFTSYPGSRALFLDDKLSLSRRAQRNTQLCTSTNYAIEETI